MWHRDTKWAVTVGKNGADKLAWCKVAPDLHFVKNTVSAKYSNTRYACSRRWEWVCDGDWMSQIPHISETAFAATSWRACAQWVHEPLPAITQMPPIHICVEHTPDPALWVLLNWPTEVQRLNPGNVWVVSIQGMSMVMIQRVCRQKNVRDTSVGTGWGWQVPGASFWGRERGVGESGDLEYFCK